MYVYLFHPGIHVAYRFCQNILMMPNAVILDFKELYTYSTVYTEELNESDYPHLRGKKTTY